MGLYLRGWGYSGHHGSPLKGRVMEGTMGLSSMVGGYKQRQSPFS